MHLKYKWWGRISLLIFKPKYINIIAIQPKLVLLLLLPGIDLNKGWWLFGARELESPELSITLDGWGDEEGWIAERGRRGPTKGYNGCLAMKGMWEGWIGIALPYGEDMFACPASGITCCCCCCCCCCLLLGFPCIVICDEARLVLVPGCCCPYRLDRRRTRSIESLCLVLSTCSHSFRSKVSISANCFNFSSSLFNWTERCMVWKAYSKVLHNFYVINIFSHLMIYYRSCDSLNFSFFLISKKFRLDCCSRQPKHGCRFHFVRRYRIIFVESLIFQSFFCILVLCELVKFSKLRTNRSTTLKIRNSERENEIYVLPSVHLPSEFILHETKK